MTVEWALIIALATGLLCGWLARWQWELSHREPDDEVGGPDDEWADVFKRWDRP